LFSIIEENKHLTDEERIIYRAYVKFFVIESLKPKSDKLTTEGVMRTL
jgi:hypothetical protein